MFRELQKEPFTEERRALFRIGQRWMPELLRKNHRRSDHWTSERAATGFIDSRDAQESLCPQCAFVAKAALHPSADCSFLLPEAPKQP